jgi:heme exporter protein D
MQWSGAAEFIAMGGYGLYVWGAYAVTAAVIGAELVALVRRGRTLRARRGRKAHAQSD